MKRNPKLDALITGDNGIDEKILCAYKLGIQNGQREPDRNYLLQSQAKYIAAIMRHFRCSAEEVLIALKIPRTDRKPILKMLEAQQKQKQQRR